MIYLLEFINKHTYVHAQSSPTLCNPMDYSPPSSSVHGIFLGKNTAVGCHFFLQGSLLIQALNSHLLNWQANSLPLSSLERPHQQDTGSNQSLCQVRASPLIFTRERTGHQPQSSETGGKKLNTAGELWSDTERGSRESNLTPAT